MLVLFGVYSPEHACCRRGIYLDVGEIVFIRTSFWFCSGVVFLHPGRNRGRRRKRRRVMGGDGRSEANLRSYIIFLVFCAAGNARELFSLVFHKPGLGIEGGGSMRSAEE